MKTLKLSFALFLVSIFMMSTTNLFAQPGLRMKAHRVIKRTTVVILVAHKKVKEGKVYTGQLARSISHQKYARILFRRGMYVRAIHHSRRARLLSAMAIKANKGSDVKEAGITPEEEELMKNAPSDDELERELLKELPNEKMKDEDVIDTELDVDLKEK